MNDWMRKFLNQIGSLWQKWTMIQRLVLIGIAVAAVAAVIAVVKVSATPSVSAVIDAPIRDEAAQDRILTRINQEGVKASISADGIITVADERTAKRVRSILIREDLVPKGIDPWEIFDRDRWTITDFERDVNLRRAITEMVTDHIKALDDVDDANVTIVMPSRELFSADQNPVTASVIVFPKPGSDLTSNIKKVQGIQKILKMAVEGLKDENITIADQTGLVLNDFEGLAPYRRVEIIQKEQTLIQKQEAKYRADILSAVQEIFTKDRVRDLNIKIEMDMSKKEVKTEEFYPITIKPQTPGRPYDDSVLVQSITRSTSTSDTSYEGTGFNPEGPPGVEGQTPPVMKDMSNLFGKVEQKTETKNEEINRRDITEERSPTIDRVTISVNIDGQWKWKFDERGKPVVLANGSIDREYIPVPEDDLRKVQGLIQDAIAFNRVRGDSVTVHNIPFDRTAEFAAEDSAYFKKQQIQTTVMIFLGGLALLLIGFIAFRLISREMERRRRLREEELSRQHQAMRESALQRAEEEGVEVSMSVEERKRMELQENAISLAKEHPEDVAQLIRTWLLEE